MEPIRIGAKTQQRLLGISAEIQRLVAERDALLTSQMEAHGIDDMNRWQVSQDFSQIIPPPEKPEPEKKPSKPDSKGKK